MSTFSVIVFPTDPFWVPSQDRAAAATAVFARLVTGESDPAPEAVTYEHLVFESAGAHFGTATCPGCGAVVARNPEDMLWFSEHIHRIDPQVTDPSMLEVTLPCCQQLRSINDLLYDPPAGFASWSISAREPSYALHDRDIALIAEALGHDVRVVDLYV